MAAERAYVTGMSPLVTAAELLHTNIPNKRTELVRGRLIVREPAGYNHGRVTMNLTVRLGAYVEGAGAGQLVAAETGFTLFRAPDTVRAPDVAFVRRERLPDPATTGFPEMAPDLVVEVLSPGDRPATPGCAYLPRRRHGVATRRIRYPGRRGRAAGIYLPARSDPLIGRKGPQPPHLGAASGAA